VNDAVGFKLIALDATFTKVTVWSDTTANSKRNYGVAPAVIMPVAADSSVLLELRTQSFTTVDPQGNFGRVFALPKSGDGTAVALSTMYGGAGIDPQGRVIITSRGTTYKIKHLRRDPRVSMLIFGEQYSGSKFVQIQGTAEIIDLPDAMDMLIYWYKQVRGEHKNWDEYKTKMADEKRAIIRVKMEKVGPQSVNRI